MLDKVTEMVAHMIGIFQITVEEGRMRDEYLKFLALKQAEPDITPLEGGALMLRAAFTPDEFIPGVQYSDLAVTSVAPPQGFFAGWFGFPQPYWHPIEGAGPVGAQYLLYHDTAQGQPLLVLEPPGSVVTITYQYGMMEDNDLLLTADSNIEFTDPGHFRAELQDYFTVAKALGAASGTDFPVLGESVHDYGVALYQAMGEVSDIGLSGSTVVVQHGAAAFGIYENGASVETVTSLDDVMPAYLQKKNGDDEAQDTDSDDAEAPADAAYTRDPYEGLDDPSDAGDQFKLAPGHEVVSGANTLVNDASIFVSWLDAPVISVMGDVINLNMISQTNLLVEHTSFSGATGAIGSASYNSATLSRTSSAPPVDDSAEQSASDPSLPANWAVTRIDGDVLAVNWVQQFSFMTDNDRADIAFSSTNTYIGLGENTIANGVNLAEIGYGYDLILIGGNLISINQVSQINVLIDNDTVSYSGMQPIAFSFGDNLLFNGVSINSVGIDAYGAMQDNFAKASEKLADGGLTLDQSVAHDSVFEGVDILRVLYISGDMTTINRIDQTNVLGDSDQVHLALDNFQMASGGPVTVTTGSNATINMASIEQYGVDSKVMVGGDVYDDALLYQAGLIDTDAHPLGVGLTALTSEAVVFLADDMLGPDVSDGAVITPPMTDYAQTPDIMQTMLA
ncbi:type I secretion protein ATPase [Phaeovulum sp.]|uniref:type I secretion protein ATPase n=1 Tax=Phaeovulum sp. TaxID=2934796 RepID=UPI0039E2D422